MAHTIIRDDEMYLQEWLDYHFSIGFEHIVVYDHKSEIPVVNKYGNKVTVIRSELNDIIQLPRIFNNTLKNFKSVWLASFDIDEFIVLHKHKTINELLSNYEDYGGLAINWLIYGSSGHIKIPEGLVKNNYLWRTPPEHGGNDHVKTIAQMQYCQDIFNMHTCKSTRPIVNEDYVKAGGLSNSSRTLCRINHYITKSLEDWQRKIALGIKAGIPQYWTMSGFDAVQRDCTIYDDILKNR